MSPLPNEIVAVITNFLPNDDITDLMLLSRNFNALVTPRLEKFNQEMATMDQHIKSFMPIPAPDPTDCEWISQLDLKRFEPIGSEAKKRMREVFEKEEDDLLNCLRRAGDWNAPLDTFKEAMSLERYDDATFLRILSALLSKPGFREEYNVSLDLARYIKFLCNLRLDVRYGRTFRDVKRIWLFYNSDD
ncbi:hypothetical protein DdX_14669 [Ditylenchus destructor]|uniref:F-box domain-containing protein n=1 Tax=Ditylenchus destructor TaxID=166010 RepID=A0AAD4MWF6_9BILA|nr:hypothetical protein DdX_14669 [Ditylenchus destructor]